MDAGAGGLLRYRPQHPGGTALVDLQRHPAERRPDGPHRAPAPGGAGAVVTGVVIGLILVLSALRVPIGFALIAAVLAALLAGGGTTPAVIPLQLFSGAAKFPLLAIPLFILAGGIMSSAGISLRIINMASTLVGHIRGGLGMVNVASSMFFAEISGSAVADVAAIGSIIMPAMVQKGYPPAFTAGLTSVAASLAIIIPPSIPMILYAVIAGTSVTRLFLTGFAPGIIGAASAVLGWYLTNEQVPQRFAAAVLGLTSNPTIVLLLLNLFLLVAGMFLHSAAAILLIVPMVMPLVRQLGIDATHFGIIVTLNLAIGQQTPPVASVLMTACAIAKQPVGAVFREAIPFIVGLVVWALARRRRR